MGVEILAWLLEISTVCATNPTDKTVPNAK